MHELALFAGAGGGILGGTLLGWRTVCAVEINTYCRQILMQRQDDGLLDPFPIWDDIRTFDGTRWTGRVDIVTGGFPCQDISPAGNRAGIDGAQSGLWAEMLRVVREVRSPLVFVENSAALVIRGLDRVLSDLHESGYDAEWDVLGAKDVGAPHNRDRCWILAYANGTGCDQGCRDHAGAPRSRDTHRTNAERCNTWEAEPGLDRVAHGVADRVDRTRAIGNGQVPRVAAAAFLALADRAGLRQIATDPSGVA